MTPRRALATLVVIVLAGTARAQDRTRDKQAPPGPATIEAGNAEYRQEGERLVGYFNGGVTVRRGDLLLSAARIMTWSSKGGEQSFEQVYAEGNVVFQRGNKKIHAERFYLDLSGAEPKGMILDFRGESFSRQFKEPFFIRAAEARVVGRGKLQAKDISLSTCSYGVPHYHLSIDEGTLIGEGEGPPTEDDPFSKFFHFTSYSLDASELYLELMSAPLFFLPALVLGPALQEFPLRHVEGGHNSRFGYYSYTTWGRKIRMKDDDGKTRVWGDVELQADWRENRGGGYGLDFHYKWHGYEGYLDTYYLHDIGRDLNLGINEKFGPLVYHDRGKAHFFHRQDLDPNWRFELEAYYVSDRDLIEEFFPKEFKEQKAPETAAYLRWMDDSMGAFAYERYKINDWQTVDEYLPRLHFSVFQMPIVKGTMNDLYLTERFDAAHIRRDFDHSLNQSPVDVWRIDSYTELSLPWDLTYAQLAPYAAQRLTYYQYTLDGDAELRSDSIAGARLSTQMHATWPDVGWEGIGLRGLRHIMEFEARYGSTLHHALDTSELYPFDAVDQLDEFSEFEFGMHTRFKTKDAAGKPYEFLSLGIEVEYYPNSRRDTTSLRVDDYLPPFNYILVSPRSDGTFPERHWSNVHYGGTFQPRNFFQAYGSGEYNPTTGNEEVRQYGLTVWPWEKVSLSGGQTYVRGVTNAYTGLFTAALTEKWAFSVQVQYDFKVDQFLTQRVAVSRDYHDFLLEGVVEHNTTTNERRAFVTFVPKFLGTRGEHKSHVSQPAFPPSQYTNPQP